MRAAMKLAMGMVPVALGVTMALMSGMAKAEEKAAQPQPLTNGVSAQTTLPSVGHRMTLNHSSSSYRTESRYDAINNGPVTEGDKIYLTDIWDDADEGYGATGERSGGLERVWTLYRVHNDGRETLINSGTTTPAYEWYTVTADDIGSRLKFKIQVYAEGPDFSFAYHGYRPSPNASQPGEIILPEVLAKTP